MKINFFILIGLLFWSNALISQTFVNDSNTWYVDDCGTNSETGESSCHNTSQYYFGNSATIDSKDYRILRRGSQDSYDIFFDFFPQFYREENKRVYAVDIYTDTIEFLIYDFNLEQGDQLEIGNQIFSHSVEVLSTDSIELYSGEKRKRMEIGSVVNENLKPIFWIEGIGSETAIFDTRYMFSNVTDIFWELNCYLFEDDIEYSLKDCQLTTNLKEPTSAIKFTVFPNPCSDGKLNFISYQLNEIDNIKIYNTNGKLVLISNEVLSNEIEINHLVPGIYFLKINYKNNNHELAKFIKK